MEIIVSADREPRARIYTEPRARSFSRCDGCTKREVAGDAESCHGNSDLVSEFIGVN